VRPGLKIHRAYFVFWLMLSIDPRIHALLESVELDQCFSSKEWESGS